jgi:hypothetical protein
VSLLALLLAAAPASAERKAVLDALRPGVEAKIGRGVEFVVQVIRVENGWAFVMADPQRKGGKRIEGGRYFDDFDNMDCLRVDAVLRKRGERWHLIDHAIGATDVWYCDIGPRKLKRGYGC